MPDLLSDLRRIVEHADPADGFDAGLSVDFIAEHGPALLARLEGLEAAVLAEREACAALCEGAQYVCRACGERFDEPAYSHPTHAASCNGDCSNCPEECGPVVPPGRDYMAAAIRSRTPEAPPHPLAKEVTP